MKRVLALCLFSGGLLSHTAEGLSQGLPGPGGLALSGTRWRPRLGAALAWEPRRGELPHLPRGRVEMETIASEGADMCQKHKEPGPGGGRACEGIRRSTSTYCALPACPTTLPGQSPHGDGGLLGRGARMQKNLQSRGHAGGGAQSAGSGGMSGVQAGTGAEQEEVNGTYGTCKHRGEGSSRRAAQGAVSFVHEDLGAVLTPVTALDRDQAGRPLRGRREGLSVKVKMGGEAMPDLR